MNRGRWTALAAVNVAAIIFGAAALFGRLGISPVWIVAGRAGFAAVALLAVAALLRAPVRVPRDRLPLVVGTAAVLAVHWIAFFASVRAGGVAIATLTFSSFPLFTLVIQAARDRRRPTGLELLCGLAIVVAVGLIARPGLDASTGALAGVGSGLAAAVLFAVFSLASQGLVRDLGPLRLSLWQYGSAALLLAPALGFTEGPASSGEWLALAALGVVGTALAHQLYLMGLSRLPAAVCGGLVSLEPVYAIALAALLFGERIGPSVVVSAMLIIAASTALLRRAGAERPDL